MTIHSIPLAVKFANITVDLYIAIEDSETWYIDYADVQGVPFDFESVYQKSNGEIVSFENLYAVEIFNAVQNHWNAFNDYKHTTGEKINV